MHGLSDDVGRAVVEVRYIHADRLLRVKGSVRAAPGTPLDTTLSAAYRAANGSRSGRGKTLPFQKPDAVDQHILSILEDNGRATNREVAESVGVSEGTVRNRIERLDPRRHSADRRRDQPGAAGAEHRRRDQHFRRTGEDHRYRRAHRRGRWRGVRRLHDGQRRHHRAGVLPQQRRADRLHDADAGSHPRHPQGGDEHHPQAGTQPVPGRRRSTSSRASRRASRPSRRRNGSASSVHLFHNGARA